MAVNDCALCETIPMLPTTSAASAANTITTCQNLSRITTVYLFSIATNVSTDSSVAGPPDVGCYVRDTGAMQWATPDAEDVVGTNEFEPFGARNRKRSGGEADAAKCTVRVCSDL